MNKKFIDGSLIIFAGLIVSKIFSLLNNILLARFLHEYNYGIILLGITILQFVSIPSSVGIPSILPKFISEYRTNGKIEQINNIISISFCSTIIISVTFSALLFILSSYISLHLFHSPELIDVIKTMSYGGPFLIGISLCSAIVRGYQDTVPKVLFEDLLIPLIKIVLFCLLFFIGFSLKAAYISYTVSAILVFLGFATILKKSYKMSLRPILFDVDITPTLFYQAWPLSLQSMAYIVNTQIDRLCIGFLLSPKEVGIYGAASTIIGMVAFIPRSFSYLSLPMLSKHFANNNISEFRKSFNDIAKVIFELSLPVFICIVFFAEDLLFMLFGSSYISGTKVIVILGIGTFTWCLIGPAADALVAAGRTKVTLHATIYGCVTNTILNITLIPLFGITGAAIATGIGISFTRVIMSYKNYKYFNINPFNKRYITWFFLCLIVSPLLYLIKVNINMNSLFLKILLSCLSYMALMCFSWRVFLNYSFDKKNADVHKSPH